MTKLDLSKIKPISGFDSLKWIRKARAQILREIKGMRITVSESIQY